MKTNGIITKESIHNFEETYHQLKSLIENNSNLKILLELDHQKNAEKNYLSLQATRIIMFGNPKLGTLLMQANQLAGLDLPQKILVTEDGKGQVSVSYNDPVYLKERHQLKGVDEVIAKIASALDKISSKATT
ncbi:DUF302 domain-containing protein [Wenyingzhuangia sp. IMCC45533]